MHLYLKPCSDDRCRRSSGVSTSCSRVKIRSVLHAETLAGVAKAHCEMGVPFGGTASPFLKASYLSENRIRSCGVHLRTISSFLPTMIRMYSTFSNDPSG